MLKNSVFCAKNGNKLALIIIENQMFMRKSSDLRKTIDLRYLPKTSPGPSMWRGDVPILTLHKEGDGPFLSHPCGGGLRRMRIRFFWLGLTARIACVTPYAVRRGTRLQGR